MQPRNINISLEVLDDDTTSENQHEYRTTIMTALEHLRDSDEFSAEDRRRADKMLYDCYRTTGANYNEHGDSSDNKHLEF